ncbi:hypothetical protein IRZ59_21800 [Pseudomonas guariconensis]|uniref:hypothetical protein n=1 Tax=Pseudomonas guariconensis TaxID=1288410 RepID=UPI0018A99407|nr:hypothetical protein [Pseudomonas guariconensis]MBF8733067.1 hypothetical protein [Pseudomonas guariconensis]
MNPIAEAALLRARQPSAVPAPLASAPDNPITLPPITGPINQYMRMQAREDAADTVLALRANLASATGRAQIINQLIRAAVGRPCSHIAGIRDVIQLLQEHDHDQATTG